ncbi:nuclear transport factor 2 family protein [Frondihabitans australicus]|uniref:SnoaL-like protein n=1 Tax=Frondihabitans australicus TaxID=386892 RepID=A0A495IMI4_9MICO|nr:nuclear transport factor 2 family protein [Frondihabitans australicus]RKR76335.1 SnoaL-like protein [Frondihabitans australicus]
MLDPLEEAVAKMTTAVEHELVVRDFIDNLNTHDVLELEPFLSTHVVYQPSTCSLVRGRGEVLRLCEAIIDNFEIFRIEPIHVATCGDRVLVEQALLLGFPGQPIRELMSFASFEVHDCQITVWRQLHG